MSTSSRYSLDEEDVSPPGSSSSLGRFLQRRPGDTRRGNYTPLRDLTAAGAAARSRTSNPDFIDAQFNRPNHQIPWKSVLVAIMLFVLGAILLTLASLLFTGHLGDAKHDDRIIPLFVLGSLVFIPGFYHVWIAVATWRGQSGYSWSQIPSFE
ncbi:hypothetical protein H696_00881 [Fonticula alba]|uniref:Transmembrane protein 230 n=1 Tax=Fonticula alba TaxID=691883 RepID=A0A058ZIJ5_FONAL|nr:hypothetical protein H696_00881 [Fonticula alba]KCV73342.1 hypothetical protein H696_00881 [Fonticula alba]|eukprot:XP_009493043.1 hypothetical protein H696_00881 [Fonticula alba]